MKTLTRRSFMISSGLLALSALRTRRLDALQGSTHRLLYVGTYTRGRSEGIYVCRMDTRTGEVSVEGVLPGIVNPSYLTPTRSGRYLYAVNEVDEYGGQSAGAVTAIAVGGDGVLRPLNQVSSGGAAPCYITLDASERFALVANYNGGSAAVLPIRGDGSLGEPTTLIQHQTNASAADKRPLGHCIQLDPSNRFAIFADKGLDRLAVYRWDAGTGRLTEAGGADLPPGSGPRHFDFSPDGRRVFAVHEQASRITAYEFQPETGRLLERNTLSTLPSGFTDRNTCADVHVAPSGRFVYSSNRGHDSIAVFAIAQDGSLSSVQHQATGGRTPRNFTLDPAGSFLLAANQNTDSVVTFAVDAATGLLTPTGHVADVPVPVCLKFV